MLDPKRDKSKGKPNYNSMWDISFPENNGKTVVTIKTIFESKEIRDAFMKLGMDDGWSQSLEKLDAVLKAVA